MRLLKRGETTHSCEGAPVQGRRHIARQWLAAAAHQRLGPGAAWVQRHAARCPRCQQRLATMAQVDLALSVVRAQPHRLDLLMRANTCAVRMLSRQLREDARSQGLGQAEHESGVLEQRGRYRGTLTNVAACLAVLFLAKTGIFSSFDKANTRGQAVMKQYYASQIGEDLAGEIFKG